MRRLIRNIASNEPTLLIFLGLVLGVITGYGAVGCRAGINAIREFAFGSGGDITDLARQASPWLVLLLPAIGGIFVAPMVFRWASEARGHGVPEVMEAIARRGARIRPRVSLVKAVASVITIGTGGSVGWEGPIIQIGSGLGSTAGQLIRAARRHMRILVACGAAAGIAATFNAPIAGVLFALEVFMGDLALVTFTPVVVASVAATSVAFYHFGPHAILSVPRHIYKLQSVGEIPLYALLGIVCAVGAVLFTRLLYLFEDVFEGIRIPDLMKPVVGGLAVGALGVALPDVLGVGYGTIAKTVEGNYPLVFLAGLFLAKLAASCLTLGSGGSGGIFAPSLVLGAVVGAGFGHLAHMVFPSAIGLSGAYAVVGMAALTAGTTHAPFAAILILFEMTDDYAIILPLMIACVISSTVARGILHESIYTLKLARRGIRMRGGRDSTVLQSLHVKEAMHTKPEMIAQGEPFREVRRRLLTSRHHVFPVTSDRGVLVGVIDLDTVRPFLIEAGLEGIAVARDLAIDCEWVLSPEQDLQTAREQFHRAPFDELPVVDPNSGRVVGILREHELHAAYNRAVARLE